MKRTNEITKAATNYCQDNIPNCYDMHLTISTAFEAGAEWTDNHQENPWHSVADGDLPNKDGMYLVYEKSGMTLVDKYNKAHNFWCTLAGQSDVMYWMEIPKRPK